VSLRASFASAYSTPDRRPIYEWAAEHVTLPPVLTRTGLFRVEDSRHLIGPFDALGDDHVRTVTVRAPVRGGKTLLADIWLPWIIANDPGPMMFNWWKDEMADQHWESRLLFVLENCPPVDALFPANRHHKKTGEVIFSNGMPLYVQGSAVSNLQGKGVRYMVNDELWGWEAGRHKEAMGRLGDFEELRNSKVLNISQGGTEDDDQDTLQRAGSQDEWFVKCEKCDHYMDTLWSHHRADGTRWGLVWDVHKLPSGLWDIPKAIPTIRFECEKCGHPHIDTTRNRSEWNRTGKYLTQNHDALRAHKSFHYSALITRSWALLVEDFLSSMNAYKKGVATPLIQFFQKYPAEPKSERGLMENSRAFASAVYEVDCTWPDEAGCFMTSDRQEEDVFWYVVCAWSRAPEVRRLAFGKAYSFAELEEIREKHKVQRNHHCIDSGFKPKGDNGVYAACIRYGWIAAKGVAGESGEEVFFFHRTKSGKKVQHSYAELVYGDPESGAAGSGRRQAPLIRFSRPTMGDRLQAIIDNGKWIGPAGLDETELEKEYRRQMASEYKKRKENKFTHVIKHVWVCPSGNNHARDCGAMQVLCATLTDILPDMLEEKAEG